MQKGISLLLLSLLSILGLKAQLGTVRGTLIDGGTGETLIGVNVVLQGTTNGASTDLDGKFSIKAEPGTYTLVCTYISYAKLTVSEVKVTADEVSNLGELRLEPASIQSEVVVITARRSRNNETAMVTMQKKSANVMDGISSQTFKKVGDGDAGAAIKRVTGVSVEGGKYVYVRGLGDRYTKTTLNGMEIPGLDPDRNSLQLDIFPTNLIDNLTVYKTFTPDLSGDFTGGNIDIITKDFPDEKSLGMSVSLGFNPAMNLNSDFVTYESTSQDLVAMGADEKAVPIDQTINLSGLEFSDPQYLRDLTLQFDPTMAATRKNNGLNTGFSINTGNQINGESTTYGYNAAISYSRSFKFYDNIQFSEYATPASFDETELLLVERDSGEVGQEEVFWSAFLSGSAKRGNTSLSIGGMILQNGLKQASILDGSETALFNQPLTLKKHILYYNQRSIANGMVSLRHAIPESNLEFSYKYSPTLAKNKEPDLRQTVFAIDEDRVEISGGNGGLVVRIYRDLEEISNSHRFDTKYEFDQWSGEKSTVKAGVSYTGKLRNFDVISYRMEEEGPKRIDYPLDPDVILQPENVFDPESRRGVRAQGVEQGNNVYESSSSNLAFYAMNELPITKLLKVIYGLRVEMFEIKYTGQRQDVDGPEDIFDEETVLDETNLLPSLGVVYNLNENTNLRVNFSQTLARPSFKEKSLAEIFDPLTGRLFIGNIDLKQTEIDNFDVRVERFFEGGQLVSLSGFYKRMTNPIELVSFNQQNPSAFTPRNSSEATLYGAEFDARKNLKFISEKLQRWSVGANFTYVYSQIDRRDIVSPGNDGVVGTEDDVSEYDERVENKRTGETIDKYRSLQGQSPYVVNGYVTYKNDSLGLECNLSYNVQGKRLAFVGISRFPNVYEQPFHSLNFKASKNFGKEDRMNVSFGVQNILNDDREKLYEAFKAEDQVFTRYTPHQLFTIGFSYKL